jgi:hypothetical protein
VSALRAKALQDSTTRSASGPTSAPRSTTAVASNRNAASTMWKASMPHDGAANPATYGVPEAVGS